MRPDVSALWVKAIIMLSLGGKLAEGCAVVLP